jgi:6-phosphogluconolactonase
MTATARPTVVIGGDARAVARLAAEYLLEAVRRTEGLFALALSGGSTPRPLYSLLASPKFVAQVPWERVHVFFADERAVPPDDPDSNFGLVQALLLSQAPVPAGHTHRMFGEAEDLEGAARRYEAELRAICPAGRADGVPALDLVVLGVGEDGHTASLFPGTAALEEERRLVVASSVPKLNSRRLTLTRPALAAARELVFLVTGEQKAGVVRRVLEGDGEVPAARVATEAASAVFFLDEAAASAWPGARSRNAV